MVSIEDKINYLKDYFKSNTDILAVWIIGSYGTEYQREESDIDFAVLFNRDMDLWSEISVEGKITELTSVENIDLVNLRKAPITLKFKTIKHGRLIYEADYIKVCDFEEETIKYYQDRRYYIDAINRDYFGKA